MVTGGRTPARRRGNSVRNVLLAPKAQERQADDHEGKVVELGDGKDACEVDLESQRGHREEEKPCVKCHSQALAVLYLRMLA